MLMRLHPEPICPVIFFTSGPQADVCFQNAVNKNGDTTMSYLFRSRQLEPKYVDTWRLRFGSGSPSALETKVSGVQPNFITWSRDEGFRGKSGSV